MKRPVAKYYTTSYVQALEPHVDTVLNDFCKYVEERFINVAGGPKEMDFGEWLGYRKFCSNCRTLNVLEYDMD